MLSPIIRSIQAREARRDPLVCYKYILYIIYRNIFLCQKVVYVAYIFLFDEGMDDISGCHVNFFEDS